MRDEIIGQTGGSLGAGYLKAAFSVCQGCLCFLIPDGNLQRVRNGQGKSRRSRTHINSTRIRGVYDRFGRSCGVSAR